PRARARRRRGGSRQGGDSARTGRLLSRSGRQRERCRNGEAAARRRAAASLRSKPARRRRGDHRQGSRGDSVPRVEQSGQGRDGGMDSLSIKVAATALALAVTAPAADTAPDKVPDKVSFRAQAFALQDVRLLDGPFKQAQKLDQEYLLSLDQDR